MFSSDLRGQGTNSHDEAWFRGGETLDNATFLLLGAAQVVFGDTHGTRSHKASYGLIEWFEVVTFQHHDVLGHGLGARQEPQQPQCYPQIRQPCVPCTLLPPSHAAPSPSLKAVFCTKGQNQVRTQAHIPIERHLGIGQHQQLFPGIPFYS